MFTSFSIQFNRTKRNVHKKYKGKDYILYVYIYTKLVYS